MIGPRPGGGAATNITRDQSVLLRKYFLKDKTVKQLKCNTKVLFLKHYFFRSVKINISKEVHV